jgi:hypothetical protein
VAHSVKNEGWDDGVAAQLRQAACDLMVMATGDSASVAATAEIEAPAG